jgi:hypothetical protein
MTTSPIASTTYIVAGAPSKEPFHNDALNRLESIAQITVAKVTTVGPAAPAKGTKYVVGSAAAGNFTNHENHIAAYYSGYSFLVSQEGWKAYDQELDHTLLFDGTNWVIDNNDLAQFSVGGLPSASTNTTGRMIYVVNASGGALPVFSDGTNWRRVSDRSIVD